MAQHVILGAGPAGINAIETLRQLDAGAGITLVCDEPAYARMVLPYRLAGSIAEGTLFTADDAWLEAQRVDARLGRRATRIDPGAHRVTLEGGESLAYDRLLVATGSRAARPPLEGLEGPAVLDMWTLADARGLEASGARDVTVVGAGFIGLIVLDALLTRGCRLRYVEIAPHVLPRMLDAPAADLVEAHLRARGVEIHTGVAVERAERREKGMRLELADGTRLDSDVVLMATGIHPNLELLTAAGLETDEGVLVDGFLRTSAADVWAAGDVAQGPDLLGGGRAVHAIQPTAIDHGRVAAANMAGMEVSYGGSLAMNVLHTQGLHSCSFGLWQGDERESTIVSSPADGIYRKYVWQDDRIVGGVMVGPGGTVSGAHDAGMLKGLVQTGVALGPWKDWLRANPLELRRAYLASGATSALLEHTLLTGRASVGGGHRFPPVPPRRERGEHHGVFTSGLRE